MRLGIDILGGDFAPLETILGSIEARKSLPASDALVLFGDENHIREMLTERGEDHSGYQIVHAPECIAMGEHPTKAIQQKPHSSIVMGFEMLKNGEIDAFTSAGNTGAMLVGSMFSVKAIPGILRPAISSVIPKENGGFGILLDVGVNADCKPEILYQFGLLGSMLAEHVYNITKPKVGLLNIGEEEEKGNQLSQAAHQLMKNNAEYNFVGNIEGRDLFNEKADVVVCDGFTGNIALKLAESFHTLTQKRNIKDEFFDRFNYESYGGAPILGLNAPVIIAHGISRSLAIKNSILLSREVAEVRLSEKIKQAILSAESLKQQQE